MLVLCFTFAYETSFMLANVCIVRVEHSPGGGLVTNFKLSKMYYAYFKTTVPYHMYYYK